MMTGDDALISQRDVRGSSTESRPVVISARFNCHHPFVEWSRDVARPHKNLETIP